MPRNRPSYDFVKFKEEIEKFAGAMLHRLSETNYETWRGDRMNYNQLIDDMCVSLNRVDSELKRGRYADRKEIRCRLADCSNALMKLFKEYE